jgi:hypothetical protein
MKKTFVFTLLIINFLLSIINSANGQLSTPPPSPEAEWKQRLGFTFVSVVYERPLMRGRKIFGELEPFGKVWRTGAGDCTTIKFSDDIDFGGQRVKAGKYSLFTIPDPTVWTVILNTDTTQHGAFNYDDKKDVLRIKVKPEMVAKAQESFTIELTDIQKDYTGTLALTWETTTVRVPLKSYADEQIMADIQDKIGIKKTENANLYYNAAGYYMNTGRDLKTALDWSQKAEAMDKENFYYVNQSTKILEKLKDYKGAIASAKRTIEIGTKKGMKTTSANWQTKVDEWEKNLGIAPTPQPAAAVAKTETVVQPQADNQLQTSISKMLTGYYAIKNALVADDSKTANSQATELVKALAAVPMAKMTAEQHTLFMSLSDKIKTDAEHIGETKDIKHQREHFNDLSNNIFTLVKGLKTKQSPVYQQYCPMKKAYWLSDNAAIKNPYYGKMMLTCGKVTETVN